jgi:tRNA modification GTPase
LTENETIAAISTPLGEGGIGIVRLSGKDAFSLAAGIFHCQKSGAASFPDARRLYHGYIKNDRGEIVDEVLVSFMPAPHTYTREDVVEINCHSGVFTLRAVLKLLLNAGARLAEPGEFTKRAFLHGRIDLSQAEAVLNMIRARSEEAVKIAAKTLRGELSSKVAQLRNKIIELRAPIEASIDYPEEYSDGDWNLEILQEQIREMKSDVEKLLKGVERNRAFQEGVSVAIIGRPNVGKSSLLNALLRQQRAIVHEMPGTTRDILEGYMNIGGYPVRLVDTAGIQGSTVDPVELEGIERSRAAAGMASMLIMVFDSSALWTPEDDEIASLSRADQGLLIVANKMDLTQKISAGYLKNVFSGREVVETAAVKEEGIQLLEEAATRELDRVYSKADETSEIVSQRHETILRETAENLDGALSALESQPVEMVSLELYSAWNKLGEIIGDTASDQLLDKIFSEFCLGK